VVLDPSLRLNPNHLIFQDDGAWRICQSDAPGDEGLRLPSEASGLDPAGILSILHDRGIRRLFIEGGAVTISRFLAAGCIDRLHLVVSPVVLGSGRSSIQLAPLASLSEAQRPEVQVFPLGQDTLFDCKFRQ
jgi:riboflavin biosynthesis pyrimidine reductase